MSEEFEIPDKMSKYLKRLIGEYNRNNMRDIATVLEKSKHQIKTATAYNNWNEGSDGHDLILLVPEDYMHLIPLDDQNEIASKIARDLNRASSSITTEYIDSVHFEYLEEEDFEHQVDAKTIARLWKPNLIKLFISHRDTHKKQAHILADALETYGISSFVAHDSIEPNEDWQNEIEKALGSMDVLLAYITDDFFDSAWTNQEIGYALARKAPVISLRTEECDPIGFIRNRQAIVSPYNDTQQTALEIWRAISKRFEDNPILKNSTIKRFANARSFQQASSIFTILKSFSNYTAEDIEQITNAYNQNPQLNGCYMLNRGDDFTRFLNTYSTTSYRMIDGEIKKQSSFGEAFNNDDDIPF